jgi:hypothetical protein
VTCIRAGAATGDLLDPPAQWESTAIHGVILPAACCGEFFVEKELEMIQMKNGRNLAEVIRKAIDDSVITMAEYEEITHVASQDGIIDTQEAALLRELNALIADKTVRFGKSS